MAALWLLIGLGFGCAIGYFHAERRRFDRQVRFLARLTSESSDDMPHEWRMGRLAGFKEVLDAYEKELAS